MLVLDPVQARSRDISSAPVVLCYFYSRRAAIARATDHIDMLGDVRLAARMLLQARGWTAVVLVSLALGIGANTALFTAINGLLLRKLPVRDPDTLVRFRSAGPNQVRTDVLFHGYTAPDARGPAGA